MNIRKLLYLSTNKHEAVIIADVKIILNRCNSIAKIEWREQVENQKSHDNQCPRCQSGGVNIVDKISHVQGSGSVDGSIMMFYGHVKGNVSIDTHEINHCNVCGHEWKKAKTKYISETNIVRVALKYLGEQIIDPDFVETQDWKIETINVFDGCCAESINNLAKTHRNHIPSLFNLKTLRKTYDSVFD